MLLRGFTAVRDLGGPMLEARPKIDKGELPGPRIYPSGAMISQTSGHGDFRQLNERSRRFGGEVSRGELLGGAFIADGRDEVLTATRENLRAGASQIKVMAGGGAASAYDPLDVAQYTLDEMKAAVEAADDWNTYVTVHAYTTKAVRRAVEAGVKCIDHGQLLDEETVKLPRTAPTRRREGAARTAGREANGSPLARPTCGMITAMPEHRPRTSPSPSSPSPPWRASALRAGPPRSPPSGSSSAGTTWARRRPRTRPSSAASRTA